MVSPIGEVTFDKEEPIENLTTWVYENGSFVPIGKLTQNESFSIVSDYIGRPVLAFDEKGEKVWSCDYDIYGRVRKLQGDKAFIPFRQLGQYEDEEIGLYYNRFRYYDPNSGLYISQDPIGLIGGLSFYAYVHDVNGWVDVFGLADLRIVNNTKIYGKGQITGLGHSELSEEIADKLANTGQFKEIHLNRSYQSVTGIQTIPRRSPDIIAVDNKGKIHAIEIASDYDMKGNNIENLYVRNELAQAQLPEKIQGEIIVIKKPYNNVDVDNNLKKIIQCK